MKIQNVSIPQAVSTVATDEVFIHTVSFIITSFNTASGKYCCNGVLLHTKPNKLYCSFNTASGKYCCNCVSCIINIIFIIFKGFNTASGKYCCNSMN